MFNKLLKLSLYVCLLGFCNKLIYAQKFPRGCELGAFEYNGSNLVLNPEGNQNFYLLQNRSLRTIELQRAEDKDAFLTPSLLAHIQGSNWAAFASDIPDLHFQCFYVEDNNTQRTDCREVLNICYYPRVKFALSNMGNYWVSTNKSLQAVIKESTAKGIYLRW